MHINVYKAKTAIDILNEILKICPKVPRNIPYFKNVQNPLGNDFFTNVCVG